MLNVTIQELCLNSIFYNLNIIIVRLSVNKARIQSFDNLSNIECLLNLSLIQNEIITHH